MSFPSLPSLPPISTGSAVLSNATSAALALGNIALVVPSIANGFAQSGAYQPQNPPNANGAPSQLPQPKAFVFDFDGEQSVELSSDITDNFIEDNTSIQDNIALRPVKIMTRGFISELNDIPPPFLQIARTIAQKLTAVSAYAPSVSETAQIAYNQAFQAYQTAINLANAAVSSWSSLSTKSPQPLTGNEFSGAGLASSFSTISTQSRQQIAFQIFYGYWITRTLFTIQTPWAVHANMAIERIRPVQSEETAIISDFECTFKQIRTVQSAVTQPQSNISQGRNATQSQAQVNIGTSTPQQDISLGTGLTGPTSASYPGLFSNVA